MFSSIKYDVVGNIAYVELDTPANRNALSRALRRDLAMAVSSAASADDVRVVLLSHTGTVFCSGADLTEVGEPDPADVPSLGDLLVAIRSCPKPVVAALDGPARAGGLGLVAACDLAFASSQVTFAFTEVRLGVVPAVISAVVLPLLPARWASDLLLTGRTFTAEEAVSAGLLTRAAAPGAARDAAVEAATDLALGGPSAVTGTKALLRMASDPGGVGLDMARLTVLSQSYFASDEGREGVRAFAERRSPAWVNRA